MGAMVEGMMGGWLKRLTVLALAMGAAGCALLQDLPEPTTVDQRLAAFPQTQFDFQAPVTIRWNDHQVPYVFAENDADAAYALGLTHAHLRLGMMAILRRATQGRIAEFAGPPAAEIDAVIRAVGLRRSAAESFALMPQKTQAWITRFIAGINDYQAALRDEDLPYEYAALRFERDPWTPEDVIAMGRLAGLDVSWGDWIRVLPNRGAENWAEILAEAVRASFEDPVSFDGVTEAVLPDPSPARDAGLSPRSPAARAMTAFLEKTKQHGSNSFVVGGSRTANGAGMIASDPHLGFLLPNAWLLAGLKTPEREVVGFMVPGLPIFGLGRNPRIAWGGTNLHAASSDLVDVSSLDESAFTLEEHEIEVRAWFDESAENRVSPYGPVVTDVAVIREVMGFAEDDTIALRWIANEPSDEFSAFVNLMQAEDFQTFRSVFKGFSIPGQNFLYADVDGNIGQIVATRLPRRPLSIPQDLVLTPAQADDYWSGYEDATTLPIGYNPDAGFLASSNNRPTQAQVPLAYFYSPPDRFQRVSDLLSRDDSITEDELRTIQYDTFSQAAAALHAALIVRMDGVPLSADDQAVWDVIESWDSRYDADSAGAVAFEGFLYSFDEALRAEEGADLREDIRASNRFKRILTDALPEVPQDQFVAALELGFETAREVLAEYGTWGAMHRMELRYPLALAPVVGDKFPRVNVPAGGSSETVYKTGHGPVRELHTATYGSQARHISDLSDPDANYFVLAGGQDGWLNSSTFSDQVELFQSGGYIRMPLTTSVVEAEFPRVMTFDGR